MAEEVTRAEYESAYHKRRRAERIANQICVTYSCRSSTAPDRTMCQTHLLARQAYFEKRKAARGKKVQRKSALQDFDKVL